MTYTEKMERNICREFERAQTDENRDDVIELLARRHDKSPASIRAKLTSLCYIDKETEEYNWPDQVVGYRLVQILTRYKNPLSLDEIDSHMDADFPNTSKRDTLAALQEGVAEETIKLKRNWWLGDVFLYSLNVLEEIKGSEEGKISEAVDDTIALFHYYLMEEEYQEKHARGKHISKRQEDDIRDMVRNVKNAGSG